MKKRLLSIITALSLAFGPFLQNGFSAGEELSEIYLRSFNLFQQASTEKRMGNLEVAEEQFQSVIRILSKLRSENPAWHKNIVDYLFQECHQSLEEIDLYKKSETAETDRKYRDYKRAVETYSDEMQNKVLLQKEKKINALLSVAEESRRLHQLQLTKLGKQRDKLQKEVAEKTKRLDLVEKTNEKLLKEKSELETNVSRLENLLKAKQKVEQTLTQLNKKEKDLLSHQQILNQLVHEKEKTIQNLEESYKQLTAVKDINIQSLEEEKAALEKRLKQLEFIVEKERTARDIQRKTYSEKIETLESALAQTERDLSQARLRQEEKRVIIENKIASFKEETAALVKERDLLREKFSQVSVQLNQTASINLSLKEELEKVRRELTARQSAFEKQRVSFDVVNKEKEKALAEKNELQAKIDQLQVDYDKQSKGINEQAEKYEVQISQINEEKDEILEKYRASQNEAVALKKSVQELEIENKKIEKKLAGLAQKYDDNEAKLAADFKKQKARALEKIEKEHAAQIAEIKEDNKALTVQIERLKQNLNASDKKVALALKDKEALIKEKKETEAVLEKVAAASRDKESEMARLNEEIKNLKQNAKMQDKTWKSKVKKMEAQYSEIGQEKNSAVNELAKIRDENKQLTFKLKQLTDAKDNNEKEIQEITTRVKKEKAELKRRIQEMLRLADEKNSVLERIRAELAKQSNSAKEKSQEIQLLNAKLRKLEEKSQQSLGEAEQLRSKLKSALKDKETLGQKIDMAAREREKRESELNQVNMESSKIEAKYTGQIAELKEDISHLVEELKLTRKYRSDAEARYQALMIENDKKNAEITRLKSEVSQFTLKDEKVNRTFEERLKEFEIRSDKWAQEKTRLEAEIAKIKEEGKALLVKKEQDLVKFQQDYEDKLKGKDKEIYGLEQKVVALKQHYEGIVSELNASVDSINKEVESKLETVQKQQQKQFNETNKSLKNQVEELNALLAQYKEKYQAALIRAEKRHVEETEALKNKIARLENQKRASSKTDKAGKPASRITKKDQEELIKKVSEAKKQQKSGEIGQSNSKEAIFHYNRGVDLADKGEIEKAEIQFKKAIELKPDFFEAHYNLGRTYVMMERKEEAIQEYLKSLAIKEDPDVYYGLGAIYWQLGKWDKVIQNWEDVLKIDPEHPLAKQWLQKAKAKVKQASAADAVQ